MGKCDDLICKFEESKFEILVVSTIAIWTVMTVYAFLQVERISAFMQNPYLLLLPVLTIILLIGATRSEDLNTYILWNIPTVLYSGFLAWLSFVAFLLSRYSLGLYHFNFAYLALFVIMVVTRD